MNPNLPATEDSWTCLDEAGEVIGDICEPGHLDGSES